MNIHLLFQKTVEGTIKHYPRYRTCVEEVNEYMAYAVGRLFVDKIATTESKRVALKMIKDIKETWLETIELVDWFDTETREKAIEKMVHMQEVVGYPELIANNTRLRELYKPYTIVEDEYMNNMLSIFTECFKLQLKKLREPINKKEKTFNPAIIFARYNPHIHQFHLSAGLLQPPLFSKDYPKSFNYGGMGFLVGHTLTLPIGNAGRHFDKDGNMNQWWTNTTLINFKAKAQCIIDQYNNYKVEVGQGKQININGFYTQGQNIADNGALKLSYKAYRKWVTRTGKEELPLPGVKYNHDQMFFINFAQTGCYKVRQKVINVNMRTDQYYIPTHLRVIGAVHNSEDFSRAFGCPVHSKMNPQKKCSVW